MSVSASSRTEPVLGDFFAHEIRAAHSGPAWHGAALADWSADPIKITKISVVL